MGQVIDLSEKRAERDARRLAVFVAGVLVAVFVLFRKRDA